MNNNAAYYRQELKKAKEKILTQIDNFAHQEGEGLEINVQDITGDLSNYDNHPGDSGNTTFEREKDLGLQGRAKVVLQMIDDALAKLDSGQYGTCDFCGEDISEERLEVMPYSTMCVNCKSEWETENGNWSRPIEEEAISQFFGEKFSVTDDLNANSYDGEDAWQELAQVGTSNTPSDIPGAHDDSDSYIDADEEPKEAIKKINRMTDHNE